MSPASSGTLEVERYIGACLISQNRSQLGINKSIVGREQYYGRDHYIPDIYHGNYVNIDGRFRIQRCNSVEGWAGGMPLISFANHQRRGKRIEHDVRSSSPRIEDQHSPLARLAVHTQGAPLILTKSYNKKSKAQKNSSSSVKVDNPQNKNGKGGSKCQETSIQNNVSVADTVSVASDESSGSSGNSENCLPRIIKPRKRRKKDRKPLLGRPLSQDEFSTDSASPDVEPHQNLVNFRPYVPFNFDTYAHRSVPESLPFVNNPTLIDRLHILGDISETPKLHHSFDEIEDLDDSKDINSNQTTTCQCCYCDPSGQIWDVDRSCYSPFLTFPGQQEIFKFPEVSLDRLLSSSVTPSNCLVRSMSLLSLGGEDGIKVSDRDKSPLSAPRSSSDLEVFTEIVTSLNGHRDLEIKFFSSSSVENVRISRDSSKNYSDNMNTTCGKLCESS